jgi:phage-related protein
MLEKKYDPQLEKIVFYRDIRGIAPVYEYITELGRKKGKDSRIKYNKIIDYLKVLCQTGNSAGEPYIKHINGDIWELRPLADRIFYAAWDGKRCILLHHFVKKSQQTPQREINTAKRRLDEARKEPEKYE